MIKERLRWKKDGVQEKKARKTLLYNYVTFDTFFAELWQKLFLSLSPPRKKTFDRTERNTDGKIQY